MISDRHIMHLDMDTFFVSVERLVNSRLAGKPVIVGGFSDRSVVSGCSYEARQFGVHSGMPVKMARTLCQDAVIVRGDMELYSKYSRLVTDIIADSAPVYEKASIDEHYLDLSGMDRFFGCMKWAHELRERIIKESGLPISFGLSANKTVAKIATGEAKPNGELQVARPEISPFLGPLSIRKIPMIGNKTFRLLRSMGIVKISTLREIPPAYIENVLGKNGIIIWKKANGIDNTPVESYSEQKSMSSEHTFDSDTTDVQFLKRLINAMTEKLAYALRKQEKLTSCITLKIRYSDFETHTCQQRIPYSSLDHELSVVAQALFTKLYTRRMLVRLIGVRFSHMVTGTRQLDLFNDKPEQIQLYQAMDRMRKRYGSKIVRRASGMG